MQEALGLSRGLHVLSMMYEHNYEIVLHAQNRLRRPHPLGDRAVAGHHRRRARHPDQVRRGRLSHRMAADRTIDQRMVGAHHERGWSMHYLHRADEGDGRLEADILKTPGKFVLEHMGGVDPSKGIDSEGFKFVLQCLDTGRCWVKLSPRISKQDDFPFSDANPLVKKLVEHAPNRLLWGSDWPHPQYFKPMPNDVALLDQMLDWVPDEKTRKLIFVDNPAEMFGFPKM